MSKVNATVSDILIQRVRERMAKGDNVAPWRKTWDPALGSPRNFVSDKAYRGANLFVTLAQGFSSPYWITAKQARSLGGSIKKGEHYTPIVYWNFPEKDDDKKRRPFARYYRAWNVEQIEGLEEQVEARMKEHTPRVFNPIDAAETIVSDYHGPEIEHGGTGASYSPARDLVRMPVKEAFDSPEEYYVTLFHELGHSTGHASRLNRPEITDLVTFGTHEYSKEELVAEMSATMLASRAGIATDAIMENSAAYLEGWLKRLEANPNWLCQAGGAAQKAVDRILGVSWGKVIEEN